MLWDAPAMVGVTAKPPNLTGWCWQQDDGYLGDVGPEDKPHSPSIIGGQASLSPRI